MSSRRVFRLGSPYGARDQFDNDAAMRDWDRHSNIKDGCNQYDAQRISHVINLCNRLIALDDTIQIPNTPGDL